jgi:hypothetical protein
MEAPAEPSLLRRWSPLWTSLAAVALFTAAVAAITSIALDEQVFHFALYMSAAVPALLLVAAAVWLWPRPSSQLGRVARVGILAGLALFGLGNALEAVGVWGWSWKGLGRYVVTNQSLAQIHDLGRLAGAVGEPVLVVGVLLVLADLARRRRRSGRVSRSRESTSAPDRGPAVTDGQGVTQPPSGPRWGEPGYVPPPPTRRQLEAQRRSARRWCLGFGAAALVLLAVTVVGYWTLQPGQDDFGAALSANFTLFVTILVIVFARRWRQASRALGSRGQAQP